MKQIQPFQKHWQQITSIVVCRLNSKIILIKRVSVEFPSLSFPRHWNSAVFLASSSWKTWQRFHIQNQNLSEYTKPFSLFLCQYPAGTRRNDNVFSTSARRRRRRVDVVKTLSLRHYYVICPLGMCDSWAAIVFVEISKFKEAMLWINKNGDDIISSKPSQCLTLIFQSTWQNRTTTRYNVLDICYFYLMIGCDLYA